MLSLQSVKEWDADWTVPDAVVRTLVSRHVQIHTCVRFGEGWDNVAYLVNGEWVFRFPRREIAVPLLETEIAVLPALDELPIPIPRPEHIGQPTELFAHPYLGYRVLTGETACRVRPNDETRAACAQPLGRFLRALHDVTPSGALPPDNFGRMDLQKRFQQATQRIREVVDAGAVESGAPWQSLLGDAPLDYVPTSDVICHGDLYDRHVLLSDGRISGIIDWGDLHRGDPAVDLSMAHRFLPARALDRFRAAYGEVSEQTWLAARFRAFHHAVACLRYALDVRDADLEYASRWSMQRLADF